MSVKFRKSIHKAIDEKNVSRLKELFQLHDHNFHVNLVLKIRKGNFEDVKQLVKSSGSIGANYIEANDALSKKDFKLRLRISRKESKETAYWLRLLDTRGESELEQLRAALVQEAIELMRIISAILRKSGE